MVELLACYKDIKELVQRLGIRIMSPSGAKCLSADCCCSFLEPLKIQAC